MRHLACFLSLLVPLFAAADTLVYVGTYTQGTSEGIYVSTLDESTGELSPPMLAARLENPSFVAIHPDKPLLYSVSEVPAENEDAVGVAAYSILEDGVLQSLNQRSTGGGGACHLSVDPSGQCVAVANYGGGSTASFPIQQDGSLGDLASFHQHVGGSGVNEKRQNAPHAHSINFNSNGTQAFVADLGKDQILLFDVDAKAGTLEPSNPSYLDMPRGGGPRHFCFHPSFRHAFSNLEMTSQVARLDYDAANGTLSLGSVVSTVPAGNAVRNSTAECLTHPNGRFVYVSNRGHNSIACFAFDASDGSLELIENRSTGGEVPRGFGIEPKGRFLIAGNQRTGNVVTFRIDPQSGKLTPTGHEIKIDSAVNVRFHVR